MLNLCQKVVGIIDGHQTMAILANVLIVIKNNRLTVLSSDTQIELKATEAIDLAGVDISFTVSGRKLLDICKALDCDSELRLTISETLVTLRSGKSQFRLSCLPAVDFPTVKSFPSVLSFEIKESDFYHLLKRTSFAMAITDVRHYLNGLLLEANQNQLIAVATNGHRLAISKQPVEKEFSHKIQSLIPRKTVLETLKLLDKNSEKMLDISIGNHAVGIKKEGLCLLSKLIDGRFPDYEQAIPKYSKQPVIFDRPQLKSALQRIAILSNEKIGGVLLSINKNNLKISSTNPDLGDAEEQLPIISGGIDGIDIGINVNYFLDVLSLVESESTHVFFKDGDSSILVKAPNDNYSTTYLIMPMCL